MDYLSILESYMDDGYSAELACWIAGMTQEDSYYDFDAPTE